jgi:uncharacterized membrane protein
MNIVNNLINFSLVFVLFILIDIVWLKFYMKNIYEKLIKEIQGEEMKIKLSSALFVYICMTILLLKFKNNNLFDMFLLGLLTYGIYDFTNYAIFTKWDLKASIADMLWGGVLFAIVSYLHSKILPYIKL